VKGEELCRNGSRREGSAAAVIIMFF